MARNSIRRNSPVCLSIYARDPLELRKKLRLARTFHTEFIELRLDYLVDLDRSKLSEIKKLLCGNEILTLRSTNEGGIRNVHESTRIELLEEVIYLVEPSYLDIEIETLRKNPKLLAELESRKSMLIASSHHFSKTPSISTLAGIIRGAPKTKSLYAVKVVCKAQRFQDNFRLLSLYASGSKFAFRVIAFCMGEYGQFSRVACVDLGSPFTYVSLPLEATAPGQLDIRVMKTLLGGNLL